MNNQMEADQDDQATSIEDLQRGDGGVVFDNGGHGGQMEMQQPPMEQQPDSEYRIPVAPEEDPYIRAHQMQLVKQAKDSQGFSLNLLEKLVNEAKDPLLVAALVVLASLDQVDQLIVQFSPFNVVDGFNGSLNLVGLVLKGLLAGVIYFIVRRMLHINSE